MLRRFRFQTKIILAQNIVILFVVIALGSIFYFRIRDTMEENILEDFRIVSDGATKQIDDHFYMMDKTALQVAANPNIVQLFIEMGSNSGYNYFTNEPLVNTEVVRLLNSYNFKEDGFERICLYNDSHDFVYTATETTTESGIDKWFQSDRFLEVQDFFRQEGNFAYYVEPSEDILNDSRHPNKPFFSVIRPIKNYTTNDQMCGYVEVQEFVRWINDVMNSVGSDAYMLLQNKDGDVVYTSPSIEGNEQADIEQRMLDAEGELKEGGAAFLSGQFAYRAQLENAPYQIVIMKEGRSELATFRKYSIIILLLLLFVLAIAMGTEIVLVRHLSRPLKKLTQSVRGFTFSNPKLEADKKDQDEFVRMQDTFDAMLSQTKEAMEREYASATNELKAQMFALQSQMNPHFLFNILAIISIEAQEDGNDKISDMCTRLRRMMAYSSSLGNGYSTIKDEIGYVVDYMELMKVRYEDMFEYEIVSDDSMLAVKVPKYVIQPICENCFKHSFKNIEPVWKIKILVEKEENSWKVEIHDNGIGFSEQYLQEFETMTKELTFQQVRDKMEGSKVGGMGIPNIYMRLMFCYEDKFVFRLYNDADGAVVLIGGALDD